MWRPRRLIQPDGSPDAGGERNTLGTVLFCVTEAGIVAWSTSASWLPAGQLVLEGTKRRRRARVLMDSPRTIAITSRHVLTNRQPQKGPHAQISRLLHPCRPPLASRPPRGAALDSSDHRKVDAQSSGDRLGRAQLLCCKSRHTLRQDREIAEAIWDNCRHCPEAAPRANGPECVAAYRDAAPVKQDSAQSVQGDLSRRASTSHAVDEGARLVSPSLDATPVDHQHFELVPLTDRIRAGKGNHARPVLSHRGYLGTATLNGRVAGNNQPALLSDNRDPVRVLGACVAEYAGRAQTLVELGPGISWVGDLGTERRHDLSQAEHVLVEVEPDVRRARRHGSGHSLSPAGLLV
ncbi:hypothetical protein BKA19_3131 [Blastococcus saxobsidens]|uniref:Uncharacterized protein n=1 Tax=Blastococcus saxobsidens TaxID=138336 RepID=A0A4Q7Y9E1_9ACTN|nr:hypothetical protein BKA19_3131 [Blastococcus saxobsidens]